MDLVVEKEGARFGHTITIASKKPLLDNFIREYEKKFKGNFSTLTNNCADAVIFALDYFRGASHLEKAGVSSFKNMPVCLSLGFLGVSIYFLSTPATVASSATFLFNLLAYNVPVITTPRNIDFHFFLDKCFGQKENPDEEKALLPKTMSK